MLTTPVPQVPTIESLMVGAVRQLHSEAERKGVHITSVTLTHRRILNRPQDEESVSYDTVYAKARVSLILSAITDNQAECKAQL